MTAKIELRANLVSTHNAEIMGDNSEMDTNSIYLVILIVAFLIYVTLWSYISLMKFYYFDASIYDLGFSMQTLWGVTHSIWTPYSITRAFFLHAISFLLFPLQFSGYPGMLIFQSIILGFGAIILYLIALDSLKVQRNALTVALVYLLYFPLYGVNFFDFHFQALFITIFLAAFYFFQKKRFFLSSALFFLSATVRYEYSIYPLMFWSLTLGIELLRNRNTFRGREISIALWNVIFYIAFLSIGYYFLQNGYIQTHLVGGTSIITSLPIKLFTLFLLLLPVGFLPVLSRRWVYMLFPFVVLLFIANNPIYEYPMLFRLQYSASFIPFIFLGLIDVLSERKNSFSNSRKNVFFKTTTSFIKRLHSKSKLVLSILLVISLFGAVSYQLYVPIENMESTIFSVPSSYYQDQSLTQQYNEISSLIPKNSPYVVIQNNIPQFLPGVAGYEPEVPGLLGPNITHTDIQSNSFNWSFFGFKSVKQINYVLADIANKALFDSAVVDGFPGMSNLTYHLLQSGYYGVLGQTQSFLLLERNYSGIPKTFHALNFRFSATSYSPNSNLDRATFDNSTYLLSSLGVTIDPGNYLFTASFLNSSGASSLPRFWLYATAYPGSKPILLPEEDFKESMNGTYSCNFVLKTTFSSVVIVIDPGVYKQNISFKTNLTQLSV